MSFFETKKSLKGKGYVTKDKLTGYGNPTTEEIKLIQNYSLPRIEKEIKRYKKVGTFLKVIAIVFMISLIYQIYQNGFDTAEVLVMSAIVCLVIWGWVGCMTTVNQKRTLFAHMQRGNFEVMDCITERIDTNVNKSGYGAVLIRDPDGHLCSDYFLIDYGTAKKYRGNNHISVLLMRQKECDFYKVYTEAMLSQK